MWLTDPSVCGKNMEMMIKLKNLSCNIRMKLANFSNSPRAFEPFQNNEVENDKERHVYDEEADLGWTDPEPICRGSPVGWVGGGDLSLVCFSFPLFAHYGDVTEIYNKGVRSLDVLPNTGLFTFSLHHHFSAVSTDDGDDIHSTIRRRVRSNNFRSNAFLKKRSNHTHIECWGRENR